MSEHVELDDYEKVLSLLAVSALALYEATLVGNPCELVRKLGDEIKNPKVGDIVMEVSTYGRLARDGVRFGRLLRIEDRPAFTPEEWAEEGGDGPVPTDRVYVLRPLRSDQLPEYTWTNARMIKVLEDGRTP